MRTPTATRERVGRTRIEVTRPSAGGRTRALFTVRSAPDHPVLRPVLLSSDPSGARVSLVPEGALLLAGDQIEIEIEVGPGARLDLVEPAGTVAYAMDGDRARWDVTIRLAAAARLTWAGEPFVVAEGAHVERRTTVELGWSAALALRETLVLGRHGESPGRLRQELVASVPGPAPLLSESLDLGDDSADHGGADLVLGGRAVTTVITLGRRLPPHGEGVHFALEAEGSLVRAAGTDAHHCALGRTWAAARTITHQEER